MKIKIEDINRHDSSRFVPPIAPTDHVSAPFSVHHPIHAHNHPHPPTHPPVHPLHPGDSCLIVFDDEDIDVLVEIFGDIDTARAVCQIMVQAPPEIKLMFYFQLRIWRELHDFDSPTDSNETDAS